MGEYRAQEDLRERWQSDGQEQRAIERQHPHLFLGIARIKYLEWVREHPTYADPETEMGRKIKEEGFDAQQYINMLYDSEDNKMLDIIADVISHMSERCCEILSKFYYEEKDLDTILLEIPTIDSKNALKTKKHKCMESLRTSAKNIYHNYLNT